MSQILPVQPPKRPGDSVAAAEVAVVAAAAAVGSLAGGLVGVFKEGISAAHDAVYTGPYAELVRLIANAVYDALAPTAAAAAAGSITSGSGGGTLWHLDYALFPLAGGIAVSLLGRLLGPGNRDFGPGLSGVIEDVNAGHPFKPRQFALKQAAAVATLGSGCSLGPEGPSVEIGIAASRMVSELFNLTSETRRVLASAGAAAGVSAGFSAPLTGVMFALEIVQPSVDRWPGLCSGPST